jgi:hypothetical protein
MEKIAGFSWSILFPFKHFSPHGAQSPDIGKEFKAVNDDQSGW